MGRNYKHLKVWNLSYELLLDIYKIINQLPESEDKNIKDQLRRAATSIPLNIAEGCSSRSNKVFLNHLNYAYGSAKESEVLLLLSKDLNYITCDNYHFILLKLDTLKSQLYNLMKSVENEIIEKRDNYSFPKNI